MSSSLIEPTPRRRMCPTVRSRPLPLLLVGILGVLACLVGCGGEEPQPNIVLVTIDTLRADRLGSYGREDARTPILDRLAASGVRFEDVAAPSPLTFPSHATILTGRVPPTHGVRHNAWFRLPFEETTLAETLSAQGYDTGAFLSAAVLRDGLGLEQGFAHYDSVDVPEDPAGVHYPERPGAQTMAAAAEWLEQEREAPFFLWIHLFEPHTPYAPPEEHLDDPEDPSLEEAYQGEVRETDAVVGTLMEKLEELGEIRETLVAVTSDHGEALGEHGESTHGYFVYQETLRVPLILSHPGRVPEGRVVEEPVTLADVFPTLLEAAGAEPVDGIAGRSLAPLWEKTASNDDPRPQYAESLLPHLEGGWSPLYAWKEGVWKYIHAPTPELYRLDRDPDEQNNLLAGPDAASHSERAGSMKASLLAFLKEKGEAGESRSLSPEEAETLRSLGYLAGGQAGGEARAYYPVEGRDPKDAFATYQRLREGRRLFSEEQIAAARDIYLEILEEEPLHFEALYNLAVSRIMLGEVEEATRDLDRLVEAAREQDNPMYQEKGLTIRAGLESVSDKEAARASLLEVLRLDPRHQIAKRGLAELAFETKSWEEAVERWGPWVADHPDDREARIRYAYSLRQVDRNEEARATLEEHLERHPDDPSILMVLARFKVDDGLYREALAHTRTLFTLQGNQPAVVLLAGLAQLGLGNHEQATHFLEGAVAQRPYLADAHLALGRAYLGQGLEEKAREAFTEATRLNPALESQVRQALDEHGDSAAQGEQAGSDA